MALNKYKIGDLVKIVDERNTEGIREFYGININKEFMPTAADTTGLDEKKYKVVRKNRFVYSGMQTGRDKCIRIALYMKQEPIIVSPAYTTFEIIKDEIILPEYFFMKFLSKEKDRLGWFYSDSSVRSNLDWDRFCDIELELPSIENQRKYVAIYRAMLENLKNYENGIEDFKLTCDVYLDRMKNINHMISIGTFIEKTDVRNKENDNYKFKGLSMENYFIDSIADETGIDFSNYKVVKPNEFACVLMKVGRDCRLTIAQNTSNENYIISPAYYTFKLKNIDPTFFMSYVSRSEFERRAWFSCDTSLRGSLPWEEFCDLKIPEVSEQEQRTIANLFNLYITRKEINEKLKEQIKNICPVLIKGSLEEAKSN